MKPGSLVWGCFALFLLVSGCETTQSTTGKAVMYEVETDISKPEPQYVPWNVNDELTYLYWRVPKSSLLAKRNDQNLSVYNFRFRYRVFQNYSTRYPSDSGSIVIKDFPADNEQADYLSGQIDLKLSAGVNHVVQVNLFDLNRNAEEVSLIDVVKSDPISAHSFEITDPVGNRVFAEYTTEPGEHRIRYSKPADQLWVRYYGREFPVASAPFTTANPKPFNFTPDSLFLIAKGSDGSFRLDVFKQGFYQLAPDSSKQRGATIFYHNYYYPEQRTVLDLILPMRYITTNQEFETLNTGVNLKQNVDEFWLDVGGSPERTRKIIKSYFNRVEYSNEHFSSYIEGWKTDRGMCFIVFGQPDAVYRTTSAERWVYGESSRYSALTLVFTKVMNPFTNNDFRLNRSSSLKTPWYRAVEFWRQGRVVSYR